jgi:putative mycofactocin binding protein MftB
MGVPSHMGYKPAGGVQVREEKFGLLFYNYLGPRLYFVPSKDLIDVDFFNGRQSVSGLITSIRARKGWARAGVGERIAQVLAKLEDKGLIYGQSIC